MSLKSTPLHDRHVALGARMVEFGGWSMPVQYRPGIKREHMTVREAVGLFDVSHMGEVSIRGRNALAAVQRLITNDASTLQPGRAMYTVMCNPLGGIVDDCIVYQRREDDYLIIVNAGNIDKDREWMREAAGEKADVVDESEETALLAIQGPAARTVTNRIASVDLNPIARFSFTHCQVGGIAATVARTGYTGEDGFEISCAAGDAPRLWDALLAAGAGDGILPIGLGARDTLRLEARLCLYGNDIDDETSPYEAGLGWVVKLDNKDCIGKDALLEQKKSGVNRKLVGFRMTGRGVARHGYPISAGPDSPPVGRVTSGTTGITVGYAIGLGYVPIALAEAGSMLSIDCRGKAAPAEVIKGPFYRRGNP